MARAIILGGMKIKDLEDELFEYDMCELYGCTPSQLDNEDLNKMRLHYYMKAFKIEKQNKSKLK